MAAGKSLALAVGLVLSALQVAASPLVTPAGPIDVGRFDLTGSALAVNAFSDHVTVYAQSRLSALFSPSGDLYTNVGLNQSFEITGLIGFGETQGVGPNGDLVFALDPTNPVNYFQLYLDTSPNADPLRGTGFDDGLLILNGHLTALGSVFNFGSGVGPLDQYLQDDYPGVQSAVAAGVDTTSIAVDRVNATVFPKGIDSVFQGIAPSDFPFTFVDPSRQYQTPTGTLVPNIGSINGADGPDLVLETRIAVSLVPEPSSLLLAGVSLFGAAAVLRRRGVPAPG